MLKTGNIEDFLPKCYLMSINFWICETGVNLSLPDTMKCTKYTPLATLLAFQLIECFPGDVSSSTKVSIFGEKNKN